MTPEKVTRIDGVGVEFENMTWHDRIEQWKEFHEDCGLHQFTRYGAAITRWVQSIRLQYPAFLEGKATRDLTEERVLELKSLDFSFDGQSKGGDFHEVFNTFLKQLEDYTKQHGSVLVKRHDGVPNLHCWVLRIRREYKRLQEGELCRMIVYQLTKLTELGFVFRQKDEYRSWEDKVEELKLFKAINGHLNIATTHPDLGQFIGRVRKQFKRRIQNMSSSITDERLRILQELGFDFQVEKWKDSSQISKPKPWEERFDELMKYKQKHGHILVRSNQVLDIGLKSSART